MRFEVLPYLFINKSLSELSRSYPQVFPAKTPHRAKKTPGGYPACRCLFDGSPRSAEKYLARIVDRQYRFAFAASEPPRFGGFEFLRTDGAAKYFWEDVVGFQISLGREKRHRFVEVVLDIEELTESEKLKYLVHLGLNFEQNQISAPRLNGFQECCE